MGNGAVAHLRFSTITALAPPSEVWIFAQLLSPRRPLRLASDSTGSVPSVPRSRLHSAAPAR